MGVHILLAIQGLVMYAVQSYFHCSYISLIRKEKHKKKNSVLTIQQEELGLSKHPVSLPCRQPVHYRAGRGIRIHSAQVRRGKHGPLQVSLAGHDQSQPAQVPLITWRREKRHKHRLFILCGLCLGSSLQYLFHDKLTVKKKACLLMNFDQKIKTNKAGRKFSDRVYLSHKTGKEKLKDSAGVYFFTLMFFIHSFKIIFKKSVAA